MVTSPVVVADAVTRPGWRWLAGSGQGGACLAALALPPGLAQFAAGAAGKSPAVAVPAAAHVTPPDVRYAPHCPFPGRCQGVRCQAGCYPLPSVTPSRGATAA